MRKAIWFTALGSLAALVGLEALFQVLPTATATHTGYHIDPVIVTYAPHQEFTGSFGWNLEHPHRHRANNYGFLTSREFERDESAVALIGDSYVEGELLTEPERLGTHLERELASRPVYAMGGPGSSLLDYAERVRFAAQTFGSRDFVIFIERGDVAETLCGSGNIHGPCLDRATLERRVEHLPFSTGGLRDVARRSALLQYLSQLHFDPRTLVRIVIDSFRPKRVAGPRGLQRDLPETTVDVIVSEFFAALEPYRTGKLVLLFDCNHDQMNAGKPASDPVRDRFMAIARERGAAVVDLEPPFRDYLARTGLRLEISPADAHLNAEGNRLSAVAAAEALQAR
jgi:hypothetical protein